ncbi:MAG TPA: DUF3604 domain-containing protein [Arenicellales bacterium]|jgi:hypothetical protein|nr:DUF3604 domain-containing protein [Pseudomonadales bacterium]MDP6267324.1 DUF3604 domain-containing protein [Arenicellales bacterium]MDP7452182.1 DUF3604 domain-containing protein [Arenicellales bacterium]HJL52605.1 DUF3604 domain-containing protein [Arenicellales bacterium]|tara:strand:- start:833 stop:2758 length:1926 start_codon:yes stop_codon:yes gene_type:complete
MRWYGWVAIAAVGVIVWIMWGFFANLIELKPDGPEAEAALAAAVEAQDEDAFYRPSRNAVEVQPANPLKNVYFGDLHIHTNLSVDSYLFGNRLDVDAAYRIAKGESGEIATGERVELTRPLDFAAVTDHAEGFGRVLACANPDLDKAGRKECDILETPSPISFINMRLSVEKRPLVMDLTIFGNDKDAAQKYHASTWEKIKDVAERHYEPGKFTTFAGYEYSPVLPDRGKHHRNIIFRSMETPDHAVSAFDAASEIDLWKQLEATCTDGCQFLTIPHNPNRTWGLAFASETIDGVPYTNDDWKLRERSEPIVEMFQIKGSSECSTAFGAGDEECRFEQFFPYCEEGQETACIHPTSMVRDGLQKGLALEDQIGINPLRFGLIGSTDTHNSNPGDTEEWDFRGGTAFASSPAEQRLNIGRLTGLLKNNPGGLAAVWAQENTREALFDAMKHKEVYATSGTRIKLRAFAGFVLPTDIAETGDLTAAYETGVPMGGSLEGQGGALSLFVWALMDPDNAPLAKLQVIKGWIENGERQEIVHDIACGGSQLDPATGKCAANGAKVDITDCSWANLAGPSELKTLWTDPDYDPDEDAFYYVRVVQNPTCRWTTYDSLRLGREPPTDVPAVVTEMAWASPIWVKASVN